MRRRDFVIMAGGAAAALPLAARAQQQPATIRRIGLLGSTSVSGHRGMVEAFRAGLNDLGYLEGKNIIIEFRWAATVGEMHDLAAELVAMKVDLIVAPASTEVEPAR